MGKNLSYVSLSFLLLLLVLSLIVTGGCIKETSPTTSASGNAQTSSELAAARAEIETLNTAKTDLTTQVSELESSLASSVQLNRELAAISAYGVWFDEYYGSGIYDFDDFNNQLGSLVTATGDANSIAAFNVFYEADQAYSQVLAGLPQDNSAWSKAQYESWRDAGQTRTSALGQVGGHLMSVLKDITWFEVN